MSRDYMHPSILVLRCREGTSSQRALDTNQNKRTSQKFRQVLQLLAEGSRFGRDLLALISLLLDDDGLQSHHHCRSS